MDKLNEIAEALANIDDPLLIEDFLKSIYGDAYREYIVRVGKYITISRNIDKRDI